MQGKAIFYRPPAKWKTCCLLSQKEDVFENYSGNKAIWLRDNNVFKFKKLTCVKKMKKKNIDAEGKGQYTYDRDNDILLFKIKEREYFESLEFDNIIVDLDPEGCIMGVRIFDAAQLFKISKTALENIKRFEFKAKVEDKVISLQLKFTAVAKDKLLIQQGQSFVREALSSDIKDSEVLCTV